MSTNTIPVFKFLFKEDFKVLNEALNLGPGFEVEECADSNELSSFVSTVPAGLIVASLKDRNDLVQIATFMKIGKKNAKDAALKIVVFNFSKDRTFEKAIAKLGILDVVEPGINTRALKFKLDFWMKSLTAQVKKNEASNPQKVKTLDKTNQAEKKSAESGLNWEAPLDLEGDIWLLRNDNDCKKVLSKWLVRLTGPSPYIGQWTEVNNGLWRFDIRESEKELFVPEGDWFFSGDQKPDFVWKENVWLISGDNFDLYFKHDSQRVSRLSCKNRSMSVCKNSMFAQTKEQMIIDSFDKELVFKKEAENLEDMEGKNKTDQINGDPLSGKSQTDEIDGGPLSGKSKTAADKSGNLHGKTEGEAAISHENMEQKTATAREKTHWGNKNSYEEAEAQGDHGVKTEKHRDGENLDREMKDREHKTHYKNHNEAEKYEASEGALKGRSSTDELPSHYDNSKKSQDKKEGSPKESDYSGKSETDKLNSHYGRESEKEGTKEKEGKDLSGKSSTDKLPSHYGKERSSEDRGDAQAKEREREARNPVSREEREREEKAQREEKNREAHQKSEAKSSEREATTKDPREVKERELSGRNDIEQKDTRKDARAEKGSRDSKTGTEKNWEGEHDYGFNGESSTDKLNGHYKSKTQGSDPKAPKDREAAVDEKGRVLPLEKSKEQRAAAQEEKRLEEITKDARVTTIMTHKGQRIDCGLDDYFDENIVFHTEEGDIEIASTVKLDMNFKFQDKNTKIKIDGNVITIEDGGDGTHFVTVQLTPENVHIFNQFMKLFEIRQQNINEFLQKVKGA